MNKNKKNRKGFTIVELVIVIAVIGILATVLVPTFGNVISDAKEKAALQEAKNLYTKYLSEYDFDTSADVPVTEVYATIDGLYIKVVDGKAEKIASLPSVCYNEISSTAVVSVKEMTGCGHTDCAK